MNKKTAIVVSAVIIGVLILDQVLKFWIKTHMYLGQEYDIVGDWFKIHFTENEGMAFGMSFGGSWGKLFLSCFRIAAVIFIAIYLIRILKEKLHWGFAVSIALIFAGALGNIIDSTFYGVIFSESAYNIATFMPEEGGYAGFLYGKVVDMLYFPIWEGYLPGWIPFWGNEYFIFFRPVFNIADASISTGVISILFFQKWFFKNEKDQKQNLKNKETSLEVNNKLV